MLLKLISTRQVERQFVRRRTFPFKTLEDVDGFRNNSLLREEQRKFHRPIRGWIRQPHPFGCETCGGIAVTGFQVIRRKHQQAVWRLFQCGESGPG